MLNLIVEKGASNDRDRSGSSITRPRTGTPMVFVQRSKSNFWLMNISIYNRHMFSFFLFLFFFYCTSFDIISGYISHSHPRLAFICCYYHLFFSSFHHIISIFISINIINSSIF